MHCSKPASLFDHSSARTSSVGGRKIQCLCGLTIYDPNWNLVGAWIGRSARSCALEDAVI